VDIVTAVQQMNQAPRPQDVPSKPEDNFVYDRAVESNPSVSEIVNDSEKPAEERSIPELIGELKKLSDRLPEPEPTKHRFHLRPDFEVKLELPDDLTEREAHRLATFLRSLPYGNDES
jgi:hypothetical protein